VPPTAPDEIVALARARAEARAARDFATADRLRGEIEAAGWKVVDRGIDFDLARARAPDIADGTRVRYGASASVPSRLSETPSAPATVVLIATDWPADLDRTLNGVRAHAPAGTQVVVVADAPSRGQAAALEELQGGEGPEGATAGPDELVWTSARLGHAAALNAGIRRAAGAVVIMLDTSVEPSGDVVTPLIAALADPSVAVAGGWGVATHDLRQFRDVGPGDVAAVEGYCLAFRRADYVARGPFDERFRFYRNLDIWWSLVLRDEGEEARPRRAVSLPLPAQRHEHRGWTSVPDAERDRLSRRNFYRIVDRFGWRHDLAVDRT
jgi:GT2 family glycosyltransferase